MEGFLGHDAPAVLALHDMKKENQSQLQKSHTQSSQAHIHMAQVCDVHVVADLACNQQRNILRVHARPHLAISSALMSWELSTHILSKCLDHQAGCVVHMYQLIWVYGARICGIHKLSTVCLLNVEVLTITLLLQDMLQQSEHVHQAVLDSAMHHCRQLHDKDVALIMAGAANISPAVQVSAMDTSGVPGPHVSAVDGHDGRSWRPWMSLAGGGPAPTYTLPATTTVCTSQHHHGPTAVAGHAGHRLADDVLEVAGAIRQSLGAGSSFSVEEITRAARQVTAQVKLGTDDTASGHCGG